MSIHETAALAIRAAKRHRYTDERGEERCPMAAITAPDGFDRGQRIWGDQYPEVIW